MSDCTLELDHCSALDLLNLAGAFSEHSGTLLLFSGSCFDSSQKSYLALFPTHTLSFSKGILSTWRCSLSVQQTLSDTPWEDLQAHMGAHTASLSGFPKWMGYCGYELGGYSDPDKQLSLSPTTLPDAYFQESALNLIFDHMTSTLSLQVNSLEICEDNGIPCRNWSKEQWRNWLQQLPLQTTSQCYGTCVKLPPTLSTYTEKIYRAKEWIYAGDCYQINLSHSSLWNSSATPFEVFLNLNTLNPAPFSGYYKLTFGAVVSSSPERLLLHQAGRLKTCPIKGTAPRFSSPLEDHDSLEYLLASPKENAELMMITDLMRNDLGRISVLGSVQVETLRQVSAYSNVYHLHSAISSIPATPLSALELLRATFPGGSITGCPKLSAMQAIHALEQRPRHLYTGSMGYIQANGEFNFNIAIRTLIFHEEVYEMQVGGAIVTDSVPDFEYQETWYKGVSMLQALGVERTNLAALV